MHPAALVAGSLEAQISPTRRLRVFAKIFRNGSDIVRSEWRRRSTLPPPPLIALKDQIWHGISNAVAE
jgi:hypothetical protein